MLSYLLSVPSGADVTATDAESYTPLMLSAVAGHVEAFNILLDSGSAIHKSVLHMAAVENHTDVLKVWHASNVPHPMQACFTRPPHISFI